MFDLGWTELLVIGIVALIVVGPKDLPGMFRTVGNFMGKARRMAREFSRAMNDAADEAGVSEVKKTLDAASNPMKSAMGEIKKSTDGFTKATMDSGKPKGSKKEPTASQKKEEPSAEADEKAKVDAGSEAATTAGDSDAETAGRKETASAESGAEKAGQHAPHDARQAQAAQVAAKLSAKAHSAAESSEVSAETPTSEGKT